MKPLLTYEQAVGSTSPPDEGKAAALRRLTLAQHERTLAWVRERLAAGEHLDDLLAEPA